MFGKGMRFFTELVELWDTCSAALPEHTEPVGYGMSAVQKPSPATGYFYKGIPNR